ncbi:MAG TPA: response regulator transcription factor [Oscillatoriales cyanobacterium M59_W2019_021]|nr:MAG: DNA-binding response regulator [Cyanobacteria bacterium J055]HIK32747.1 response regulator transcription factor [Oscillatoriales cyanobacterium M4454_W2019_049]HIK52486.1 response regulator transcription factor [Oscillatoriales cyanobacterium M59_W2019_021]
MRILLVEDDPQLAEALSEILNDCHYVVDRVGDGESAWLQAQILEYDLMLLDVMLPNLNGFDLCRRLRSTGCQTPILMVTARDTSSDKVNGLDSGADDYIVKPFDVSELLARVRALLRRGQSSASPILESGDLRLNPVTYDVTYHDLPLKLTPKEYALLELLLRNQPRVLPRSTILEHVWSLEDPPAEETVKAHIKGLRHKLRAIDDCQDPIETVRGVGYRLRSA